MTKSIRIENADNSNHMVRVRVMRKSPNPDEPDTEVSSQEINHPTAMVSLTIWGGVSGQYLIVEEV